MKIFGSFACLFGSPPPFWGDGFAEDGFRELASVRSWDELAPDHYVRLHPNLMAKADGPACQVKDRLEDCVAVRFRQLVAQGHAPKLTSMTAGEAETIWANRQGFCGWHRAYIHGECAQIADLLYLDKLLSGVRSGCVEGFDPARSALFAFLTCVHPAYMWPEALLTHERDAAAAWLGILAQGRRALMPSEVADYFVDVIARVGAKWTIVDAEIAALALNTADAERLWSAATARRQGRSVVVRPLASSQRRRAWRSRLSHGFRWYGAQPAPPTAFDRV